MAFGCRIRRDSRRVIFKVIMFVTGEHDSIRQVNSPDFGSGGGESLSRDQITAQFHSQTRLFASHMTTEVVEIRTSTGRWD